MSQSIQVHFFFVFGGVLKDGMEMTSMKNIASMQALQLTNPTKVRLLMGLMNF